MRQISKELNHEMKPSQILIPAVHQASMANSRLNEACHVVHLIDGNLLIEVDCFESYAEALQQFNKLLN